MLLIKLIRYLCGYVRVTLQGKYPERFLNLCAQKNIKIWNTHPGGEKIEFCLFAKDYKRLRALRVFCPVKIRVRRKYGLPFLTKKYRHRKGMALGLAVFVAALCIMPKFVWGVRVSGNQQISEADLRAALKSIGIYEGAPLSTVDAPNMRLRLALLLPEISWAAINVDGAFINVEVRETDQKQAADTAPCNLVASCDGRITAVYLRKGTATVKVGDGVRKGDLLASGTEQYSTGATKFRHSDGEIIAEVEKTLTVKIPINQTKNIKNGKAKVRRVFTAFSLDIPLYIGGIKDEYQLKSKTYPIEIMGVRLPFAITEGKFYLKTTHPYKLTEQGANSRAEVALKSLEAEQLGGFEILKKTVQSAKQNEEYVFTATYLCKGNIAQKEYIYIAEN